MKTKEELFALKEEVEALSKKLRQLTGEELYQVCGGSITQDNLNDEVQNSKHETNSVENTTIPMEE